MKRGVKFTIHPLISGIAIIAWCWLGSAYILIQNDSEPSECEPKQVLAVPVAEVSADNGSDIAAGVKPSYSTLPCVLTEIDVYNPSVEHQEFLHQYAVAQRH